MPPRRSARLVELANPHFQLPFPPNVVALLFSLLPLDARLRAREVCRGWRLFLEDVRFWQSLDFSKAAAKSLTVALTWGLARAACARAKGTLHTLDLYGVPEVQLAALEALVAENGESLRLLMTPFALALTAENVARVRQAALLCKLRCHVECTAAEVVGLLRCESVCPYALKVNDLDTEQQQTGFAAALATRTGIKLLSLFGGNFAGVAALEVLARAMVAADITSALISHCRLTPPALPALTLLLRSTVLHYFTIYNRDAPLFTGPDLPAFCDALRSNTSLQDIMLDGCDLWAAPADAGMVLAALAARTTPFNLGLFGNNVGETQEEQVAAGTQLAQLITAGGLETLQLYGCSLGEAGLAPIFEALSRATALSKLSFSEELSREFARDVVLPAVRDNTSLWSLDLRNTGALLPGCALLPELREAHDIVAARRQR